MRANHLLELSRNLPRVVPWSAMTPRNQIREENDHETTPQQNKALDQAKEAVAKERNLSRQREQAASEVPPNLDLMYCVSIFRLLLTLC
ncbi:hypothetical protein MRX96_007184 [Rhipicephalus microplus]